MNASIEEKIERVKEQIRIFEESVKINPKNWYSAWNLEFARRELANLETISS